MRMRLRRREAPQLGVLGALALSATLLSVAAGAGSTGREHEDLAGSAWRGLVGSPREQVAVGQRVIVVLNSPSLSDRVAAAGGLATEAEIKLPTCLDETETCSARWDNPSWIAVTCTRSDGSSRRGSEFVVLKSSDGTWKTFGR